MPRGPKEGVGLRPAPRAKSAAWSVQRDDHQQPPEWAGGMSHEPNLGQPRGGFLVQPLGARSHTPHAGWLSIPAGGQNPAVKARDP